MNISIVKSWEEPKVVRSISVSDFLAEIKNPDSIYKEGVINVRNNVHIKDEIKKDMPCALPHGVFSYGNDRSIINFSDHLFVDFDFKCTSQAEAAEQRDRLIQNPIIKAAWLSSSGTGVHVFVYCPGLDKHNFKPTMEQLHIEMKQHGFVPDKRAKDVSRKMVMSFDPDLRMNAAHTPFGIVKPLVLAEASSLSSELTVAQINAQSLDGLLRKMKVDFRTPEDFSDGAGYHLYEDGKEIVRIWFKGKISNGRNNTLVSVAGAIVYINPWIVSSPQRLRSVVSYINNRICNSPVPYEKVCQICDWAISRFKEGTLEEPRTETRKIIINREVYRTPREAQSVAAKVSGAIRRKKKIKLLRDAYIELQALTDHAPTQKDLHAFAATRFKVGIRTVKGYWNEITRVVGERCS